MIRIYNGGIVFSTEVLEKKKKKRRVIITVHTLFNCQEEIQQLVCWPEELDDKWSLNSAIFAGAGHVTSQISTPLPASKSPGVTGSADKK